MITTVAVLATLLAAAATLQAAVGARTDRGAPRVEAATAGSMLLTNSNGDGAIFTLANMAPGESGEGEVTISNIGTALGRLVLSSGALTDAPGRFGGTLSERLQLRVEEVGSGAPSAVYSGGLADMPELRLGSLAVGESRTYRFLVTMLDGGAPASPFVDDNAYQRASTAIGYEWALTESEEAPEPKPPAEPPTPPAPPPAAPSPRAAPAALKGTPGPDRLIGSSEDDVIFGRGGADRIYGKGGRDRLYGGAGRDRLYGGAGADRLRGGAGRDRLHGGPGPDLIFARGGGRDFVACGGGRDRARVDKHDRVRGCERVHGR